MTMQGTSPSDVALWLNDEPVTAMSLLKAIRKSVKLDLVVRELILEKTLSNIQLSPDKQLELMSEYRKNQNLEEDEGFADFLNKKNLNMKLLQEIIERPVKVVKYREERWGPRAESIYLKNKESFEFFTYRRLQAVNASVMQEVYFRIKDEEESWTDLAKQFPGTDFDARQNLIPVSNIEPPLVDALRRAGIGKVIRPMRFSGGLVVVAELEAIKTSSFNEETRNQILIQEFENWISDEVKKLTAKLKFES
ncbi:MAG: hypothetical protein VYE46_08645 [Cyanobacteriota bacterium]|nr:hypothetical protein [Cyanobacteriota bacterium]